MDGSSLPYTCNTCLVAWRSSQVQREHMRTDWQYVHFPISLRSIHNHTNFASLYNVKRRVASLPPVSLPTFNEKVLAVQASSTAAAAKASFEKTCLACQKTFYSENSYQNHIKSSKHKARETRMSKEHADDASSVMSSTFSLGEPINKTQENDEVAKAADGLKAATIEEEDEQEEEPDNGEFSSSRCLFCNNKESDINANIDHMLKSHGMFVPEKDYLVDPEGLIKWLYRKINENNECLYCHAIRNNPAGARTHMRDKGHCMIAFETEDEQIEIGQYYDFRSTYSDDDAESTTSDVAEGGVKVTSEGDDDGWETDASSVDDEDEDEEEEKLALSRKNNAVVIEDEFELHLPSGRTVGHRSLAKYYRQNLHNYPTPSEREERQLAIENGEIEPEQPKPRGRNLNRAVVSRANGGSGMVGIPEEQRRAVTKTEHKQNDRAQRQEFKYRARVNKAANHQKHYRVCFCLPPSLSHVFPCTNRIFRIPSCNDHVREWRKLVSHGGLFYTMIVMFLRLICLRIPLSILHMFFFDVFVREARCLFLHER